MAQSERSKYARVKDAWLNYQRYYLGLYGDQINPDPPQQFQDIFWLGAEYAVLREEQ